MRNRRKNYVCAVMAALFFIMIALLVYSVGYKRGHMAAQCERFVFDLGLSLDLYDMRTNLPSNVVTRIASEGSIKLLIYGQLLFLEQNTERIEKTLVDGSRFRLRQKRFNNNVDRAKQIVEGIEKDLVYLGDAVRSAMTSTSGPPETLSQVVSETSVPATTHTNRVSPAP